MMFSDNQDIENYLCRAPGITRGGIIAEFGFQKWGFYPFIIYRVFNALGRDHLKKIYPSIGFIIPISIILTIILLILNRHPPLSLINMLSPKGNLKIFFYIFFSMMALMPLTYITALLHALHINDKYQRLALELINDLDNRGATTDYLLKKAIIYGKVFDDRKKLFNLTSQCLDMSGGDSQLWNLAGELIASPIFDPTPAKWLFEPWYRICGLWQWRAWHLEEDATDLAAQCLKRARLEELQL